jgi:hypothetical protein
MHGYRIQSVLVLGYNEAEGIGEMTYFNLYVILYIFDR